MLLEEHKQISALASFGCYINICKNMYYPQLPLLKQKLVVLDQFE